MNELPLSRFRVLDLTTMRSGPTAVRQFADWGAEVIMVERKEGGGDVAGGRLGADFQNLHRNKKSLALDLKSPEGREVLLSLVNTADVLFENYRPDVKHRLGIDYETLKAINPKLVYVSISGFGQDGPYAERPGLDQVVQGMCGLMSITGAPGGGPMRAGIAVTDTSAGLFAALGAMMALLDREVTGEGRWVCTSLLQAGIAILDFQAARWLIEADLPVQAGNDHPSAAPMGVFKTSDGDINLAVLGDRMFRTFCAEVGLEHLLVDPRFELARRVANRSALNAEITAVTVTRSTAEWVDRMNAVGIPCGPIYAIDQVFADRQVQHLGIARAVQHPELGEIEMVGQPVEVSDLDGAPRAPAPALGEHTSDILEHLGFSTAQIEHFRTAGAIL